jgi:hypothetical protein
MEEKGKDFMGTATEKAKDFASGAADKARDLASGARDVGANLVNNADSAAASVGGGMRNLADTIKQHTPHEGFVGGATGAVAGTIESAGRYLEDQGVSGAAEDLVNLIRKNPIPALFVGIGLGFLMARVLRS